MRFVKVRLLASVSIDRLALAAIGMSAVLLPSPAAAAGTSMPWETPLQSILDSVQGPVAKAVGVIIIVVTGLTLAFAVIAARRDAQIVPVARRHLALPHRFES